ncbi:MAG: Gfo/Idh/MocA family oxidoreductase [candidate division KSB1 bacterium]|nr:Gfo/Idh/MocA family oxidoreductase [candidate division KSB1 bacterium]MDZ7401119.1 Gfo/Idh/MocA family oxidoreductase [candidate division KSB1 bacterium]
MQIEHNFFPAKISRRDFIKRSGVAASAMAMGSAAFWRTGRSQARKQRIAIVGVGSRSRMYQDAVQTRYAEHCQLVGLCDINLGRLRLAQQRSIKNVGSSVPIFDAKEFDKMIRETRPDRVVVTTVDGFHHQYIIRAMELGCDVITEKPMTIDAEKCQAIIDTQARTGRKCTVTFNYRYSPPRTQIKELLMSGIIGDVLSVDFHWMLNTFHGADYFRRWHSQKKFSGGLMVHKATHHFDLVNWWLSAVPISVYATGKREFYTPEMAKRFGLDSHHERCHPCPEKKRCGFELDLAADKGLKELYLDNEQYDGYYRDRCVFRPDIDIEDTMNVLVKYDNNVTLCYSLNAFNSWEGYTIVFNGTKGRLEHRVEESIYISGTDAVQGGLKPGGTFTRVIPLRGPAQEIKPWMGIGGHGGGDQILLDDLFLPEKPADKYLRAADQRSGAYSILIGIAANICFEIGKPVTISDLVHNIGYPDYPAMPSRAEALPMPEKNL